MAARADAGESWSELFLSAALEPEKWHDAIRAMAVATRSRHGQLIGFGPGAASFNWISDVDAGLIEKSVAIDQSRAGWLLDATGRVAGMTPRAEALLSSTRLRLDGGRLASDRADESRIMALAAKTAVEPPARAADPVALADEEGGVAIMIEFYPLPARPWSLPFAPRAVAVARVGAPTDRHLQLLMNTFRLTRAEADIAVRLAAGQSRQDIATARSVSTETLKAQLRSIYDKTGCNRESQLVRLVGLLSN